MNFRGNTSGYRLITFIFISVLLGACKDRFEAEIEMSETGFLVVEGYINIGEKSVTTLYLSRTTPIDQGSSRVSENGALVHIESELGELFSLAQTSPGTYVSDSLDLLVTDTYRVRISIDDKVYLSSFVRPIETPDIDSVSWHLQANNDVHISVSTHDDTGEIQLYQWEYDEVWETNPPFMSLYDYVSGTTFVNRSAEEIRNMQTCWKYVSSYGFNILSTKAQTQNVVLNWPIVVVPRNSERLDVRYSIEVRQHALSNEAYDYIQLVLKNSQNLGTFSDPLPGQLTGNFYCTSSPEPVVGLMGAYTTKSKRIFIDKDNVPYWDYSIGCQDTLIMYTSPSLSVLMKYNLALRYHFTEPLFPDGVVITANYCADCRIQGGNNIRPPFWDSNTGSFD